MKVPDRVLAHSTDATRGHLFPSTCFLSLKTSKTWLALHYLPNTAGSLKELTFAEVESSQLFHQAKRKHSEGRNPITIISVPEQIPRSIER